MLDETRERVAMEPEAIMPAQFFTDRQAVNEGERRLLLAILEDAIRVLAKRRDTRAERAWIASDDEHYGSFLFVWCVITSGPSDCGR